MTTTQCDLCGVECGGDFMEVRVSYNASNAEVPVFVPLTKFEYCKSCWSKLYSGKIRLVIEPEENKTPYPEGVEVIR